MLAAVLAFGSFSALPCRAAQEALQPVEFPRIQLGGFWKQQVKRLTEKWLPHCVRRLVQLPLRNEPGKFFDVEYPIPEDLTRGKAKVTVRFQAEPEATAGGVFGLRTLEAKP
jgi:uncharacterized protein